MSFDSMSYTALVLIFRFVLHAALHSLAKGVPEKDCAIDVTFHDEIDVEVRLICVMFHTRRTGA
jgi:hypothetical protein